MTDLEELTDQLGSALAHLDGPAHLENHPLANRIVLVETEGGLSRGQLLRRALRLAIEALDPGPGVPTNAPEARAYQILSRRYVAKESMVLIASRLAISERQAYRELRRGIEAIAQIMSDFVVNTSEETRSAEQAPERSAHVREELERLAAGAAQDVDVSALVSGIVSNVRPLATERGIQIEVIDDIPGLQVALNRVMLRQAIFNLLSHIVRITEGDKVLVRLSRGEGGGLVQFEYRSRAAIDLVQPERPYAVAAQLLDSLGLNWQRDDTGDGEIRISVRIPLRKEYGVLIVDDNEGLIALFTRFLRHQPYRVRGATDFDQALEMMRLQPDVVILDIMLPDRDGWEVLQALRQADRGSQTRFIVCSIIDDPELSSAMGADVFLHKPVDRLRLIHALDRALSSTT